MQHLVNARYECKNGKEIERTGKEWILKSALKKRCGGLTLQILSSAIKLIEEALELAKQLRIALESFSPFAQTKEGILAE